MKTFIALALLALATPAYARLQGGPSTSAVDPASTASPADRDPSAQRTNYAFVEDGSTHRKVVSDYCFWRSDAMVCK